MDRRACGVNAQHRTAVLLEQILILVQIDVAMEEQAHGDVRTPARIAGNTHAAHRRNYKNRQK